MEIIKKLNDKLLYKDDKSSNCLLDIDIYKRIAYTYSVVEQSIAVLSDMQFNTSYVYSSKIASELGLQFTANPAVINSIWEEEILKKIHPDDKLKKYIHELRFFTMMESLPHENRSHYSVLSRLRIQDKDGSYRFIQHRMFYFYSASDYQLRFALCLYNIALDQSLPASSDFLIVDSEKGKIIIEDKLNYKNILSKRELEILKWIGEGYTSKEIAELLSISINTVSRHRQNILLKLNVKNSVEAVNETLHK